MSRFNNNHIAYLFIVHIFNILNMTITSRMLDVQNSLNNQYLFANIIVCILIIILTTVLLSIVISIVYRFSNVIDFDTYVMSIILLNSLLSVFILVGVSIVIFAFDFNTNVLIIQLIHIIILIPLLAHSITQVLIYFKII